MARSKILCFVRSEIRRSGYSYRVEQAYEKWIRQFIRFHDFKHPGELSWVHITEFMAHLATTSTVTPAIQQQALSALLFLYENVLHRPLDSLTSAEHSEYQRLSI